jgi:hypothetical protein
VGRIARDIALRFQESASKRASHFQSYNAVDFWKHQQLVCVQNLATTVLCAAIVFISENSPAMRFWRDL